MEGFKDLNVFQEARELVSEIYELTNTGKFVKDFGLKDQIRRASISIVSNIAEGYERKSKKEKNSFLNIAKEQRLYLLKKIKHNREASMLLIDYMKDNKKTE